MTTFRRCRAAEPSGAAVPTAATSGSWRAHCLPARSSCSACSSSPPVAKAPPARRELKFGHVGEPGSLFALSADEFARRANERLPEGWEVVTYGSSQLGGRRAAPPEDPAWHRRLRAPLDDHVVSDRRLRSLRDAVPRARPGAHAVAIEEAVVWPDLAPLAEAQGYRMLARVGERLPARHQQPSADRGARGPGRSEAPHAERGVAAQALPGARRQPHAHGTCPRSSSDSRPG